ncbi:MAG: GC-type dockerin domain-anchored protein [Planctomycetota bacterium]
MTSFSRCAAVAAVCGSTAALAQTDQIHVSFLWHMHQPVYVPYQTPLGVDASGVFSFSVTDVHNGRFGPYTTWPSDAVNIGSGMPYLGAQVSFSGSLIENLDSLDAAGVNGGMWSNWKSTTQGQQSNLTAGGNRRLEMVAFGYHHPLMPLIDERDIRKQIELHKLVYGAAWGSAYSAGMFPPETAFSTRMIPALVAEGIDWVMVDNIHFDRACIGYPHTNASNLFAPNRADRINPDPAQSGGAWVQLQNLWAPSRVSAPFGYQPHKAQHIDPETGAITRMTVVPAARYEGNEDGRGGYGAFLYDQVMDALLPYNDPQHPILVNLHHDGDNFGGGSEAYYHSNFQNMVNWASSDPDYDVTTINDYLDRFPVDPNDVIHVEDGSWAGADNGDPEFKKWLGDPDASGVSPDINSWAALVAAQNRVHTADTIAPSTSAANILNGTGTLTDQAWRWLLVSQASDYWYWDGTEVWDSNVTRGSNHAVALAEQVIQNAGTDPEGPTVFVPQREPYNPGGYEWDLFQPEPSDFEVWTLVDDYSGLSSVVLNYRIDLDGENPLSSIQNETYAGGAEVGAWTTLAMVPSAVPTPAGVLAATRKADRYSAMVVGESDVLIDYYVEATDTLGNVTRSPIMHVYVGSTSGGDVGGPSTAGIDPEQPNAGDTVTLFYDATGGPLESVPTVYAHIGFNGWDPVFSPDQPMTFDNADERWEISIDLPFSASQLDAVFNDGANTWDNNGGADWHFDIQGGGSPPVPGYVMDGSLDSGATLVGSRGDVNLYAAIDGDSLYLATTAPTGSDDRFLTVASSPGAPTSAMWAKAGNVAAWDAFLAAEGTNGYHDWFDSTSTEAARGAVLEGLVDIDTEFGAGTDVVYAAVLTYQTSDGGALVSSLQLPAGDGDSNVDATEYLAVILCDLPGASCCQADLTTAGATLAGQAGFGEPDGLVDLDDLGYFLNAWLTGDAVVGDTTTAGATLEGQPGFGVPDGVVELDDLGYYLNLWLAGCA